MKTLNLGRLALSLSAAIALLAGCGRSQPPVGAADAMPQSRAITMHADRGGPRMLPAARSISWRGQRQSWMSPEATSLRRLLYISDSGDNDVYVFSLPRGRLVGTLTGFRGVASVCSDKAGDVFVVDYQAAGIKEYRHGGKMPIVVLNDPNASPIGCSVDPMTGNLAVTNQSTVNGSGRTEPGDIVIYANAQGTPKSYAAPNMVYVSFDSYDGDGNLYVSGVATSYEDSAFAELSSGTSKLKDLTLNQTFCCAQESDLQWDGQYLAVANQTDAKIYQFAINGTSGKKVGTTPLTGASSVFGFWIQNDKLYAPATSNSQTMVGFYSYPSGGTPTMALLGFDAAFGATVSVRP